MPDSQTKASRKVFVVGCSGSGKTTVARILATRFEVQLHELDFIAWDSDGALLPYDSRVSIADRLSSSNGWVAEGTYLGWTSAFMERADVIVWMDVPLRVALWRVFWRHLRAELRRDNRFPGWIRLFRFMRMVADQYRNRSDYYEPPDIQICPDNIEGELRPYSSKVVRGSNSGIVPEVVAILERERDELAGA